jgi:hypothetical protein
MTRSLEYLKIGNNVLYPVEFIKLYPGTQECCIASLRIVSRVLILSGGTFSINMKLYSFNYLP